MSNPFLPEKISRSHLDGDTARIIAKIEEEELCNRDLLRKAAPRAWKWARLFDQDLRAGTLVQPGSDASREVLDGWRLFRRGYIAKPLWLRHEQTERKMRQ